MDRDTRGEYRHSYDRVAEEYVRRVFDELRHKPLDRALLDRFAARFGAGDVACDLGCGPGQVARYLHERGVRVVGVDLSSAMVAQARRLTPEVAFRAGDMTALDEPDGAWAGIAAFYSLIHIPPADMAPALAELRRVLRPGGTLLAAFHLGDGTLHRDEWWGQTVSVDFFFYSTGAMAALMEAAGFAVKEIVERDPYPEVEHPSRRAYLFARRPHPS